MGGKINTINLTLNCSRLLFHCLITILRSSSDTLFCHTEDMIFSEMCFQHSTHPSSAEEPGATAVHHLRPRYVRILINTSDQGLRLDIKLDIFWWVWGKAVRPEDTWGSHSELFIDREAGVANHMLAGQINNWGVVQHFGKCGTNLVPESW